MKLIADLELRQQLPSSVVWCVPAIKVPKAAQAFCWRPQYLRVLKELARTDESVSGTGAEEKLRYCRNWVN